MNIDASEVSTEYKENHSIVSLGSLLQYLKIGSSRSEVEELLGKATLDPLRGTLYDIVDLRALVDLNDDQSVSMPVFLRLEYEGDEQRRQIAMESGDLEPIDQGLMPTDKLFTFAILPIGE